MEAAYNKYYSTFRPLIEQTEGQITIITAILELSKGFQMTEMATNFAGSIPENYDKYLVPLIFHAYAKDMGMRVNVPGGSRVLEIAAGTGAVSRVLRDILPADVHLTVTDLNEPMLEVCQSKFGAHENTDFKQADAMELPFEDNSFDAIVCQFGVMFFPDRALAYKEIARVLKPGGTFYFNVWDAPEYNELSNTIRSKLFEIFPETPPTFFETPFGNFQIDHHRECLSGAGYEELSISVLPKRSVGDSARHVAMGMMKGSPLTHEILEINNAEIDSVLDEVAKELESKHGASPTIGKMQAIVFEARLGV